MVDSYLKVKLAERQPDIHDAILLISYQQLPMFPQRRECHLY